MALDLMLAHRDCGATAIRSTDGLRRSSTKSCGGTSRQRRSGRRGERLAAYTKLLPARQSDCALGRESRLGFDIGDMSPMWTQYCVKVVSPIAKVDAISGQCDLRVPNASA